MDDAAVVESIDRILKSLDEQMRSFEHTLANLKNLLGPLDEAHRERCLDYLFTLLVKQVRGKAATDNNSLERQRKAIGILFRVLFEFGRVELTLCKIVAYLDVGSADIVNNWISCVSGEITAAVYTYASDLGPGALEALKSHAALFSHPGSDLSRAMPALSPYVIQLNRAIGNAEFSRFEEQLRGASSTTPAPKTSDEQLGFAALNPSIDEALKEAAEYLRSGGTFDPKKAADLLRSSIDESHREIVKRLVERTGSPYRGGESDGKRREYFRTVLFISEPEEKFFSAIYTLLSEEASHRLVAPRETVLVMEQTVRSYLSLLVRRLSGFSPPRSGEKT